MTSLARTVVAHVRLHVTREARKSGCWSFLHRETNLQFGTDMRLCGDEFGRQIARRLEEANPRECGLCMQAELDFSPHELKRLGFNADDVGWMLCAPVVQELQAYWLPRARE